MRVDVIGAIPVGVAVAYGLVGRGPDPDALRSVTQRNGCATR